MTRFRSSTEYDALTTERELLLKRILPGPRPVHSWDLCRLMWIDRELGITSDYAQLEEAKQRS